MDSVIDAQSNGNPLFTRLSCYIAILTLILSAVAIP
jgi:hypothetical protein